MESPLSTANLVETALGLVVVLGVMLGLAWLAKRVQVPGVGGERYRSSAAFRWRT